MIACGPFTVNNELSYDALKDLMMNVKREQPHALILTGPFVSHSHEDIISGDLKYKDPENGSDQYMDYCVVCRGSILSDTDHTPARD